MSQYAYVMVIWGNEKYIIGALVSAYSLLMVNTKHDIVIMVANMLEFDKYSEVCDKFGIIVKKIDLYENNNLIDPKTERQKEFYQGYFYQTVITKWKCLDLVEYKKICFLDADVIFIRNPDRIFNYNAPASIFKTPFMYPYTIKKTGRIYNPYVDIGDGDKIPKHVILDGLKRSSSVSGFLVLLEPKKGAFKELVNLLNTFNGRKYGYYGSFSAIDEQIITDYYYKKNVDWYNIDPYILITPWLITDFYRKEINKKSFNLLENNKKIKVENKYFEITLDIKDVIGLHYLHDKPWEKGEGEKYLDTAFWWNWFFRLCDDVTEDTANNLKKMIDSNILSEGKKKIEDANKIKLLDIDRDKKIIYQDTYTPTKKYRGGDEADNGDDVDKLILDINNYSRIFAIIIVLLIFCIVYLIIRNFINNLLVNNRYYMYDQDNYQEYQYTKYN